MNPCWQPALPSQACWQGSRDAIKFETTKVANAICMHGQVNLLVLVTHLYTRRTHFVTTPVATVRHYSKHTMQLIFDESVRNLLPIITLQTLQSVVWTTAADIQLILSAEYAWQKLSASFCHATCQPVLSCVAHAEPAIH